MTTKGKLLLGTIAAALGLSAGRPEGTLAQVIGYLK